MIIYRPHRGLLADALLEAKEFNTEQEMKQYIYEDWNEFCLRMGYKSAPFEIDDIVVDDESVDDERCGWHDTRDVCVKRMYGEIYKAPQIVGMCATDYEMG